MRNGRRTPPPPAPRGRGARAPSPAAARRGLAALAALAALGGCDKLKETTDRHFGSTSGGAPLVGGGPCPEAVPGRTAGAESASDAFGCFRKAVEERSAELMLRVTCQGRSAASCKQDAQTKRAAQEALNDLARHPWRDVVAQWAEAGSQTEVYAVETHPRERRVTTVTLCRIVEKTRWAVCELGEMSREAAERKAKSSGG
jgi:hypothetical protein